MVMVFLTLCIIVVDCCKFDDALVFIFSGEMILR